MKKVVPRSVALYRYCRGYFLFHRITALGRRISEEGSKGNSRGYLRRKEKENGKKDGYNL